MIQEQPRIVNIGLIGFGFIGKLHANAYFNIPYCFPASPVNARIAAVLRNQPQNDQTFAKSIGIQDMTANFVEFYNQTLDLVDICTPNALHLEQVQEALTHCSAIYCEKPLGKNLAEARFIESHARSAKALTHVAFMLRYIPALRQMKSIIENGAIGEVHHFRAHFFHSSYLDPKRPMTWRLRLADSGGGALADLGIHILDQIRSLLGEVDWIQCQTRTFIHQRPTTYASNTLEPVGVDDWALCTLGMKSGAVGTLEVSRFTGGIDESTEIEIFGSKGSVKVNLEDPLTAQYYDVKRKQWLIGPQDFPPPLNLRPIEQVWPASKQSMGDMLNAHLACALDFLLDIREAKNSPVNFHVGLAAQEILEAAYLSAGKNGIPIQLPLM